MKISRASAALGAVVISLALPHPTLAGLRESARPADPPDSVAASAAIPVTTPAGVPDSVRSTESRFPLTMHPAPLLRGGMRPLQLSPPSLSLRYSFLSQQEARDIQPTRFDTGVLGADRGAYAGMMLGFVGTQSGLWGQRTSWYLMGAGAALGALWGSTAGVHSPGLRVHIEPRRRVDLDRWDRRE